MASSPGRRNGTNRAVIAVSDAWKQFYQTPDGRIAIAQLLLASGVYVPIETSDPLEMARLNGERNVALRIVQMIGLKPEEFPTQAVEDEDIIARLYNPRH
jgi:hypothetical protein